MKKIQNLSLEIVKLLINKQILNSKIEKFKKY